MAHNKVVLVVDDDPEILTLVEIILKRQGYAVMKASDASVALHLINSLIPNLFVIDLMMPGIDGFELVERIRNHGFTQHTPIVILTARSDTESREQAFRAGATAFLNKSLLPNGLVDEVRALLNSGSG